MLTTLPFLVYKERSKEAIDFYASIFPGTKVNTEMTLAEQMVHGTFELNGQKFLAIDAGPHFSFSDSFSMFVACDTQEEVDRYWERLLEGGTPSQCGWLTDRYGLSWQIIPRILGQLVSDPDKEKAGRAQQAMLKMGKIVIADLQAAFDQA